MTSLTFRSVGNELTPSAKYDFKFKDYAPWVFRELREDYFHLDPADYLLSLTAKYILSELGSPGKSGSFFYWDAFTPPTKALAIPMVTLVAGNVTI